MPRPKRTLAAIGPVEQQAIQPRARVIIDLVEDMPPSARLLYDILAMMPKELALLIHSFWLHEIEVWDETRATHEIGRGFEDLYASTEKDLLDGHVYGDDDLDELTSHAIGVFQSSGALVRGIVHTGQGRRFETSTGLFYADDSAAMSKDFIVDDPHIRNPSMLSGVEWKETTMNGEKAHQQRTKKENENVTLKVSKLKCKKWKKRNSYLIYVRCTLVNNKAMMSEH